MDSKRVFPEMIDSMHMPFFDGANLVFSKSSRENVRESIAGGKIWETSRTFPHEAFKIPRKQSIRYRAWKLAYSNWSSRSISKIATGLPESAVECSPTFYFANSSVHISFIGGIPQKRGIEYKLYTMTGTGFDNLEPAQPFMERLIVSGFVNRDHICWARGNKVAVKERATQTLFIFASSFKRIVRLAFLAEEPSSLLVTGCGQASDNRTILYDLKKDTVSEVIIDHMPVYKSTIYKQNIIFAKKQNGRFEDRDLHFGEYQLLPSSVTFVREEVHARH